MICANASFELMPANKEIDLLPLTNDKSMQNIPKILNFWLTCNTKCGNTNNMFILTDLTIELFLDLRVNTLSMQYDKQCNKCCTTWNTSLVFCIASVYMYCSCGHGVTPMPSAESKWLKHCLHAASHQKLVLNRVCMFSSLVFICASHIWTNSILYTLFHSNFSQLHITCKSVKIYVISPHGFKWNKV